MNLDEKQVILKELCEWQAKGTAPIFLSIGWTDENKVVHDDIVIQLCPPLIINKLIGMGHLLSIDDHGAHILSGDKRGGE